jgi:hypothetical protein
VIGALGIPETYHVVQREMPYDLAVSIAPNVDRIEHCTNEGASLPLSQFLIPQQPWRRFLRRKTECATQFVCICFGSVIQLHGA